MRALYPTKRKHNPVKTCEMVSKITRKCHVVKVLKRNINLFTRFWGMRLVEPKQANKQQLKNKGKCSRLVVPRQMQMEEGSPSSLPRCSGERKALPSPSSGQVPGNPKMLMEASRKLEADAESKLLPPEGFGRDASENKYLVITSFSQGP